MVEEVNKIIYNMLIGGKGVLLPGVGTLYIERQGAKRISKDRLLSPRNAVNFSSQAEGRSIVDEIVAIAGCSEEQARDIYDRWLAKTREGKRITIGGVGVLNDKSFSPEAGFNAAINPGGVKTLVVRRHSNAWLYAVSGVCVAVALCVGAYMMWGEKLFGGVSVVGSDAQTEMTAQVTADSTSAVQGIAGDSLAMAETVSSETAETATQTASTASTAASESTAAVSGIQVLGRSGSLLDGTERYAGAGDGRKEHKGYGWPHRPLQGKVYRGAVRQRQPCRLQRFRPIV